MRNKLFGFILAVFLIFGISSSGAAITLADVGDPDDLIAVGNGAGLDSEAAEINFIYTVTGVDVEFYYKYDTASELDALNITNLNSGWAWDFDLFTPDYYLVKVGKGEGAAIEYSHWLFANNFNTQYAYILNGTYDGIEYWTYTGPGSGTFNYEGVVNGLLIGDAWIEAISHIARAGGTPVPEPGMVILLGIGLIGLAFFSRKRLLN